MCPTWYAGQNIIKEFKKLCRISSCALEDEGKDHVMVMIYANDLMIVLITGAHKLLMKQEEHL